MRSYPNSTNASVSGWVNDRPDFCAGPLPNNRSSECTMRSLGTYRPSVIFASLVPLLDCLVQFLDDLARSVVGPQFHEAAPPSEGHDGSAAGDGHDDEFGAGAEDSETSANDDRQTPEGNDDDGSKADESGDISRDTSSETGTCHTEDDVDASGRQSGALPTPMGAPSTSGL
ncbi:Hypothetical predicted protein [Olea europaea subsp. europaea]|uniref:Uncharacterized protein n=1 Tax=Olea europaea subsp. europaea TaxID=158383 RepID=A0A8S0P9D8_OLEEU|nr:Hypothetical predicted protein [Olea europaea subsp. europaea]